MIVTASDPAPAAEGDRLDLLDAARGIALAGIFLMNLAAFSGFAFMTPEGRAGLPTSAIDAPVGFVSLWLTYGKFSSIFSLLFGIGFSLQLAAAARRGDGRLSVFRRRLAVLAALLVLAPVLLQGAITVTSGALDPGAPLLRAGGGTLVATGFAPDAMPYPLLRDGGWIEYLRFQLSGGFYRYGDLLTTGRPFKVLAMFLLGLWVGRSGMLRDLGRCADLLRRSHALDPADGGGDRHPGPLEPVVAGPLRVRTVRVAVAVRDVWTPAPAAPRAVDHDSSSSRSSTLRFLIRPGSALRIASAS